MTFALTFTSTNKAVAAVDLEAKVTAMLADSPEAAVTHDAVLAAAAGALALMPDDKEVSVAMRGVIQRDGSLPLTDPPFAVSITCDVRINLRPKQPS